MENEPVERRVGGAADDRRPVAVGLVLWLIATVVVATVSAVREVPTGVLWTCIAGLILGIAGLVYITRRSR
jgi:Na+/melibiose symporter-like transporter